MDGQTKGIMMTAFAKMANLYEEVRPAVTAFLTKFTGHVDVDLQQRSNEYLSLSFLGPDVVEDILREMPPFDTQKVSTLELALEEEHSDTHDKNVYKKGGQQQEEENGGEDEGGREPPRGPPPRGPPPQEEVPNLLGDFESTEEEITVGVPTAQPVVGVPDQAAADRSFGKMVASPQGVLFQDAHVQVGLKHEYRGSQGRIQVRKKARELT